MLKALLTPWNRLKECQDTADYTQLLVLQEELRWLPYEKVWEEFCKEFDVLADDSWYQEVKKYEKEVLEKRK